MAKQNNTLPLSFDEIDFLLSQLNRVEDFEHTPKERKMLKNLQNKLTKTYNK